MVATRMQVVLNAIEHVESGHRWWLVSKSGCIGMMQVCPRFSIYKRNQLFIPEINRMEAERMLASWLLAANGNMSRALAAYRYGYDGLYGKRGKEYAEKVLRIARQKKECDGS